ncbi:putative doxorubicin resistance ABC transporter permease protein DrrC [Rhodococcus sp. RD6.2]|uniref:ABC transporter permease n=1 Tax=Rhodococcus sp. RD6.2 TaxID=260936 RepID=UPI00063B5A4E|nr:ABC transporter permease [Rhodococcus sp. RD6.2]CRK50538.1 putative doxorubicin resistance ABC transporter permease protein DrrC [Rhodococcus sp. RD6.2]
MTTAPTHERRDEGALTRITFQETTEAYPEDSRQALITHSLLQTQRLLTRWMRDPFTMLQAIVYPSIMLLMFNAVLGSSVTRATGINSVYGYAPMITLVGSMFGSIASGMQLKMEWHRGLLSRFWILPVHRASGLISRLLAESVRIVLTTVLILMVGMVLGFRFNQGPLAGLALICVPLLMGLGFATMVTALSVNAAKAPLVELLSLACSLLMFFNSGFVPTAAYPTWLQGFVENQPMSTAIDAMKGLSLGGPVAEPLIKTVLWSVGAIALFTWPAIRGYRKAAGTPA